MKWSDMPFRMEVEVVCPVCETRGTQYRSIHDELPREGEIFHCGTCLSNLIVVADGYRKATPDEVSAWAQNGGLVVDIG